jgi:hypothetical protein
MSDPTRPLAEARAAFSTLPVLGKAAIGVIVLVLLVMIPMLWDLGAALVGPRPSIPPVAEAERRTGERAAAFSNYVNQIEGRSLFFNPRATVAQAPPPVVDEGPREAPRPTSYGGPQMTAMIFDEVWFADGTRLKVGEPARGDVRVVAINPPWDATLEWRGVEFKVELFQKNTVVFREGGSSPANDTPPPDPPPPEPANGSPTSDPPTDPPPGPAPTPPQTPPAEPPPTPPETGEPPAAPPREGVETTDTTPSAQPNQPTDTPTNPPTAPSGIEEPT